MFTTKNTKWGKATIWALSLALTLCGGAAIGGETPKSKRLESIAVGAQTQANLEGILFLGPVDKISSDGLQIQIFGNKIINPYLDQTFLPAQYIAVYGKLTLSGSIEVYHVEAVEDVYSPGASLVIAVGKLLPSALGPGYASLGRLEINTLQFGEFGDWSRKQFGKLAVVIGTQAIAGAAIDPQGLTTFDQNAELVLGQSGDSIHLRGIDGSGTKSIGWGIDGSGASTRGIDGSGASTKGIDGSGALIQGIDGSGASTKGIDGSGALTQGIDGSGAPTKGIDGPGA